MISKNIYYQILVKVFFLLFICFCIIWFGFIRKEFIPVIFLLLVMAWNVVNLVNSLNRTNIQVNNIIHAYIANDFSSLTRDYSKGFHHLYDNLNKLGTKIQQARLKYESQDQLYQTIIENAYQGILCFDEEGKILIVNKAFTNLSGIKEIVNIKQISSKPSLYNLISTLDAGSQKVYKEVENGFGSEFLIHCNSFKILDKKVKILFILDIKQPLEQKELESWTRLMRTIVHEIMNSIAPMTSLTETLLSYYTNSSLVKGIDEKLLSRTLLSLETIKERGEELTQFVEKFRQLNQVSKPEMEECCIRSIVESVLFLLSGELQRIVIENTVDKDIHIVADKIQIKHLIINVLRNSIEALKTSRIRNIYISSSKIDNSLIIKISDSGQGIPPELLDDVFTPFFTTKDKGTGIGLSLCRTMMASHHGEITLQSIPDQGTSVNLKFRI